MNCFYTGGPAQYIIGVAKHNKRKVFKIAGAVCTEKVLEGIEHVNHVCFGTNLWPVVMDLTEKIIYHSYEAEQKGMSAEAGWEYFIKNRS